MFETRRKTEVIEPPVRPAAPEADPRLRNEMDPDPLIEEMVARLREGLGTLIAIDEWGRPLAWRNVVRLALGPLASRLRDTEQALDLAVSMLPPSELVAEPVLEEPVVEEPVIMAEPAVEPQVAAEVVQPPVVPARPGSATSLFTISGDQRTVPVSPFSAGQLLRGGGADDSTTAKYDRFLTGLYGEGQQVRRDQDGGPA